MHLNTLDEGSYLQLAANIIEEIYIQIYVYIYEMNI